MTAVSFRGPSHVSLVTGEKATFDGRAAFEYIKVCRRHDARRKSGELGGRHRHRLHRRRLRSGDRARRFERHLPAAHEFEYSRSNGAGRWLRPTTGRVTSSTARLEAVPLFRSGPSRRRGLRGYGSPPAKGYDDYAGVDVNGRLARSPSRRLGASRTGQGRSTAPERVRATGTRGTGGTDLPQRTGSRPAVLPGNLRKEVYKPDSPSSPLETKVVDFIFNGRRPIRYSSSR